MRILQVVEASFAGVGRHVLDLSRHLIGQGVEVHLVYGSQRADSRFLEDHKTLGFASVTSIEVSNSIGLGDVKVLRQLRSSIEVHAVDLVHGHASKGGALARLSAMGTAAKSVYTPNALITQAPHISGRQAVLYRAFEVVMAKITDALIYVSEEEQEHGHRLGLRPRRNCVIPNGIDLADLPSRRQARDDLGIGDGDAVTVGFVGRLSHQKNVDLLLEALHYLPGDVSVEVIIIGAGEQRAKLEAKAKTVANQTGTSVTFLGRRDGPTAMPAFDIFALPSKYEGFPYVLLEALQAGVPCVATIGCAAGPLFGDGRAGQIVQDNAKQFALGLNEFASDPTRLAEAKVAASSTAASFSARRMTASVVSVYRAVLDDEPTLLPVS